MTVAGSRAEPRRLYLHIGLQGTGASHLQDALVAARSELAAWGVDLVLPTEREAHRLMLAVRGRNAAKGTAADDDTTLQAFAAALASAPGSVTVFSQESLAATTTEQVATFLRACDDREVHVVLTVRALARQLPATWQQALKANRTVPYRTYLHRLQRLERSGSDKPPWINLDPVSVLSRWSASLPPERVHVVTLPPEGSPHTLLLERFCEVIGVDPARMRPESWPSDTSLGRVEAELLRRVNTELPHRVRRHDVYDTVGTRFFAAEVLRNQASTAIVVPNEFRSWCESVTDRTISALDQAGYRIVGSLDDLRCTDADFADRTTGGPGDDPSDEEIASAGVTAITEILTRRGLVEAARRDGRIVARPTWQARLVDLVPSRALRRLRSLASRRPGR